MLGKRNTPSFSVKLPDQKKVKLDQPVHHDLKKEDDYEEKQVYQVFLTMNDNDMIYRFYGIFKNQKQDDGSILLSFSAPPNKLLPSLFYSNPGEVICEYPKWINDMDIEFYITFNNSTFCHCKHKINLPNPLPSTFEYIIYCKRTQSLSFTLENGILSCIQCIINNNESNLKYNNDYDKSNINQNNTLITKKKNENSKSVNEISKPINIIDLDDIEDDKEDIDIKKRSEKIANAIEDSEKGTQMIFTPYIPKRVPIHCEHPAKIVESTTLAGATLPSLNYRENLPDICTKMLSNSVLSAIQLETVKFVGMRHQKILPSKERAGYFIGDGTGVGKGRQIAAIIADNFRKGRRRAVWISASSSLIQDSKRDLSDIGAEDINIFPLPVGDKTLPQDADGVLFVTYSMLVGKGSKKQGTRYQQIINWITIGKTKEKFSGPIIFDEAHFAKNLTLEGDKAKSGTSLTAKLVNQLQIDLPLSRIVYVSATGASDPKHMAYMRRLGLWGPGTNFPDFNSFKNSIGDSVAAMEMVAMEMKSLGMYCSRHLSFEGTKFDMDKISLTIEQKKMYDMASTWWSEIIPLYFKGYQNGKLSKNSSLTVEKQNNKHISAVLWSAHQRFFLQLCMAVKISECVKISKEAIDNDYSVVIGLFTTGESSLDDTLSKSPIQDELLSAPKLLAQQFLDKWFPKYIKGSRIIIDDDDNNNNINIKSESTILGGGGGGGIFENNELQDDPVYTDHYNRLRSFLDKINLPDNPIDELISKLGGPNDVAEITGRSQRLVYDSKNSNYITQTRKPKIDNIEESSSFMNGSKKYAIISEAASTGISLHSSISCKNQKRRMHIILQLPWSAEKAVQQLGRTHRSYQVIPPHYKLLLTDLGGERRLASVVAMRLGALGALTSGDRRATSACDALSDFVISNKYGTQAIQKLEEYHVSQMQLQQQYLNSTIDPLYIVLCRAATLGALGSSSSGKSEKLKKFLNRILGLSVEDQQLLFNEFIDKYDNIVLQAQTQGSYDDGIYDIVGEITSEKELIYTHPPNPTQKTYSVEIEVYRGVSWEEAMNLLRKANIARKTSSQISELEDDSADNNDDDNDKYLKDGFYENKRTHQIILACQLLDDKKKYHIVQPHIGHQSMPRFHSELKKRYQRLPYDTAKERWIDKYTKEIKNDKRNQSYCIISGSILPICHIVRKHVINASSDAAKLTIVRALCTWNNKAIRVVGLLIPVSKKNALFEDIKLIESEGYRKKQLKSLMSGLPDVYQTREKGYYENVPVQTVQNYLHQQPCITNVNIAQADLMDYMKRESTIFSILKENCDPRLLADYWRQLVNMPKCRHYCIDKESTLDPKNIVLEFFELLKQQQYQRSIAFSTTQ